MKTRHVAICGLSMLCASAVAADGAFDGMLSGDYPATYRMFVVLDEPDRNEILATYVEQGRLDDVITAVRERWETAFRNNAFGGIRDGQ